MSNENNPSSSVTLATFIELERYKNTRDPMIDIGRPRHSGGTAIVNINCTELEVRAAINVFKEIKCDCLFVCPTAAFGLVPFIEDESKPKWERSLNYMPPPYLSIHQYRGGCDDCVRLFGQLMIQELAEIDTNSTVVRAAVNDATAVIHNIMKKE